MANTLSTKKRARQTETRNARNKLVKTRYKNLRKKVEAAVAAGDKKEAEAQFRLYVSALDRAAKSNVIHKNSASSHKSRVSKLLS